MPFLKSGMSQITDHLFLCGISAISASSLEHRGITHILNTAVELDDYIYPLDKNMFIKINHIVMRDAEDEDLLKYLDMCVDHVNNVCQANGIILVHCVAGVSRSASVCIAYMMKCHKMTLKKAYYHVMNKRPGIFPNFGFWRQLVSYEMNLRGENSVEMLPLCLGMVPDILLRDAEYRINLGWMDDLIGFFSLQLFILILQIVWLWIS